MSEINLIGYWKFEDDALDSSGQDNHGSVTGCAYADGKIGRCITMDGSGDKVDCGNISGLNGATALTFLAWIKFNSTTGDYSICSKGIWSGTTPILFWRDENDAVSGNNDCLSLIVYDGDTAPRISSGDGSINDTNWHHIGFTFEANTTAGLNIYIDSVNSANCDTTNCNNIASSIVSFILGTSSDNQNIFNGYMDEVKLYNRVLSDAEIEDEYNRTQERFAIKNAESGLIGYWKLEDNAIDSTGNNTTGSEYNMTYTTGKIGTCGSFNGSSSYISVPHDAIQNLNSTGTISLWAYSNRAYPSDDGTTKYRGLISKTIGGSTANIAYFIDWYGTNEWGQLRCDISNGTSLQGKSKYITFSTEWVHIVFSFNGQSHKLYINGVEDEPEVTQTISAQTLETSLDIGRVFKITSYWDGLIDEVKIYNRALSADEVAAEYSRTSNQFKISISEQGLVGHWKLEDNALDSSGNGVDGTEYYMTYTDGKIGRCGDFNGSNGYIETGISSVLNVGTTLTACAWIYRETNDNSTESIIHHILKGSPWTGFWLGSWSDGKLMAFVGNYNTHNLYTTDVISNEEWHHVALISNGSTFAIWVDGDKASADKAVGSAQNDVSVRIGWSASSGQYFDGLIDDVRIYNRALSQEEITNLYNNTLGPFRLIL